MIAMIQRAQDVLDRLETERPHSVVGSFLINDTPCKDSQMMDFMHPDSECVKRIMQGM